MGRPARRVALMMLLLLCASLVWAQDKDLIHPSSAASRATPTGRRVALVIGNKSYTVARPLWSPVEDARAWAGALEAAGFEVITCYDCTLKQMKAKREELRSTLKPGDEALLYYSGHGAEQDDRNLLFPIDAEIKSCGDLDDWSVSLNSMLGAMELARTRVVVLDACRDPPFPSCTKSSTGQLFRDEPISSGTLIAYATRRGYSAQDGAGELSPFTRAVLPLARTPGLPFTEALSMARDDVQRIAEGQEPYTSDSLSGRPWALVPGPHPEAQQALLEDQARRREAADAAFRAISGMPDGEDKRLAYIRFLSEHGGSGASSVLVADGWLQRWAEPPAAPSAPARVQAAPLPLGRVGSEPLGGPTGRIYTALEGRPEAMRFVQLSAGEFTMGSPEPEGGDDDERPQHRVRVASAFYVGETEVTQGQWAVVVKEAKRQKWPEAAKLAAQRSTYTGDPARPVETVSWCDALRFANALSRMEKLDSAYEVPEDCEQGRQVGLRAGARPGFRLPLEAEWEYAARAGTEGRWWFGEEEAGLCTRGNVADEATKGKYQKDNPTWQFAPCSDGFPETAPVRRFSPNPWGLYDTIGNVWEWTEDAYAGDAYTKRKDGVEVDPRAATMALHSGDRLPVAAILAAPDASRVVRGGGWSDWPIRTRSAGRGGDGPGGSWDDLGLRLVLAAAPGP